MQLDHHEDLYEDDPRVFERTPPQDLMAEQSVLGGMLLSRTVIDDVCEIVTTGDFYKPAHGVIFDAITELHADGHPVDAVSVVAHLVDAGIVGKVGGGPYIQELVAAVPTAANAGYYAGIVNGHAQLRRLIETGTRLVQYGYGGAQGRDIADVVNLAQSALSEAALGRRSHAVAEFTDFLDENLASILAEDRDSRGLSTGLGILDDVIGGLKGGQLVVVAARPGMGKTIHAVDMLRASAIRKAESVLMHSLEMSKEDIQKRILAAEAEVNLARITNGGLRPDERAKLTAAAERIRGCFIHIDDTAEVDIAHIRATARKVAADKGLALVVVDYLQLMATGGTGANRATELGAVSRGLKILARELDVPIVACAQLNRGSEQRTDKRPQLSDLRESGAIEQDADVVILLHRPDYADPEHARAGEVDLIVAKNRNGPIETVSAVAQLAWARFVDPSV
jgi:replicative DNA helicase